MTKEEIIKEVAQSEKIKEVAANISKNNKYYKDELLQELFLVLCNMPEERITSMYEKKQLDYYIIGTLSKMFNSTTSKFYYQIKKPIQKTVSIPDTSAEENWLTQLTDDFRLPNSHDYSEAFTKIIIKENDCIQIKEPPYEDRESFFDIRVFNLYLKHGTIKKVSEQVNISKDYVTEAIKRAKQLIRDQIQKAVEDKRKNSIW